MSRCQCNLIHLIYWDFKPNIFFEYCYLFFRWWRNLRFYACLQSSNILFIGNQAIALQVYLIWFESSFFFCFNKRAQIICIIHGFNQSIFNKQTINAACCFWSFSIKSPIFHRTFSQTSLKESGKWTFGSHVQVTCLPPLCEVKECRFAVFI